MTQKKFQSGIFITGVRKCGTTTLFDALARHSGIIEGRLKEPQFFCLTETTVRNYLDWYAAIYPNEEGALIDGSTYYYQYPAAYGLIDQYFERAWFLLCLRDPATRFYSAYWHMRGKPDRVETRSLEEIIAAIRGDSIEAMLEKERAFIETSARRGTIDLNYMDEGYHRRSMAAPFPSAGLSPASAFEYFAESVYSLNFPAFQAWENTHVVVFEQLLREPEKTLREVYRFLGLSPEPATLQLPENRNRAKDASGSTLLQGGPGKRIFSYAKAHFGKGMKSWLTKHFSSFFYSSVPEMKPEEYALLRELLCEEYVFWFNKYPELEDFWAAR